MSHSLPFRFNKYRYRTWRETLRLRSETSPTRHETGFLQRTGTAERGGGIPT